MSELLHKNCCTFLVVGSKGKSSRQFVLERFILPINEIKNPSGGTLNVQVELCIHRLI